MWSKWPLRQQSIFARKRIRARVARARRPLGRLRAGSRDSRQDASATTRLGGFLCWLLFRLLAGAEFLGQGGPSDAPDREFATDYIIVLTARLHLIAPEGDLRMVLNVEEVSAPQMGIALGFARSLGPSHSGSATSVNGKRRGRNRRAESGSTTDRSCERVFWRQPRSIVMTSV